MDTSQADPVARWKEFANLWITPLEQLKDGIRAKREELDRSHPDWKDKYDADQESYLSHDARREYFVTLRVILQNAQLSYLFVRDQMTNPSWWQKEAGAFDPRAAAAALREYGLMVKFFTFHAAAMATEETVRAIVRAGGSSMGVDADGPYHSVYSKVLRITDCQQCLGLFEIVRLARNTIHTNGVYLPANRKDRSISFRGRSFEFRVGRTLDWLGEQFAFSTVGVLSEAMMAVVTSEPVSSIAYCPRGA